MLLPSGLVHLLHTEKGEGDQNERFGEKSFRGGKLESWLGTPATYLIFRWLCPQNGNSKSWQPRKVPKRANSPKQHKV